MRLAGILLLMTMILFSPRGARSEDNRARAEATMNKELARSHHETAKKHFQLSNFEEALVQFKMAYKYAPLPKLLFNIAACHEGLGNLREARDTYWLFLQKMPGTPHRAVVEARIENLTKSLSRQDAARAAAASEADKASASEADKAAKAQPVPAPGEGRPSRWKKIAGWTAVGVGGAAMITGAIFGALAQQKESEYRQGIEDKRLYHDQLQTEEAGRRYQTAGVASLVVGGVIAAAGGGVLLWEALGRDGEKGSAGLTALAPFASQRCFGVAGQVRF